MHIATHFQEPDAESDTKKDRQIQEDNDRPIIPPGCIRPQVLEAQAVQTGQEQRHGGDVADVVKKAALTNGAVDEQVAGLL
jgi:hypothetical protein